MQDVGPRTVTLFDEGYKAEMISAQVRTIESDTGSTFLGHARPAHDKRRSPYNLYAG